MLLTGTALYCSNRSRGTAVVTTVQGTRGTRGSVVGATARVPISSGTPTGGKTDALSRRPCGQCGDPHNVDAVHMSQLERGTCKESLDYGARTLALTTLQSSLEGDSQLGPVRASLLAGKDRPTVEEISDSGLKNRGYWAQWDQLFLENGVVYRSCEDKNGRRVLKQTATPRELVPVVIKELHDRVAGGHLGVTKTVRKARERFCWIGLREDIELWCRQCPECAKHKSPARSNRVSIAGAGSYRVPNGEGGPGYRRSVTHYPTWKQVYTRGF